MAEPALLPLSKLPQPFPSKEPKWNLKEVEGRLVEISDPHPIAALSFAFLLLRDAQANGSHTAWIGSLQSTFYPPDTELNGINLRNLPVLRMVDTQCMGRAAETLLRSGAFQLVLLDLGRNHSVPVARLAQLNGLARKHNACILFLTEKQFTGQSIGPLISLHAHTSRERIKDGEFLCRIHVLRDKRRGTRWTWQTRFAGVDGYY